MTAKRIEVIAKRNDIPQRDDPLFLDYQSIFNHPPNKLLMLIAFLTFGTWIVGCGSNDPYGLVPLEGAITYEDGTSIPNLQLQFISTTPPIDAKTVPRPCTTMLSEDGVIEYGTTYKFGDGIIVGKHKVVAISQKGDGSRTKDVPLKYGSRDTTPLTVDTADMPFEIKIEKP